MRHYYGQLQLIKDTMISYLFQNQTPQNNQYTNAIEIHYANAIEIIIKKKYVNKNKTVD